MRRVSISDEATAGETRMAPVLLVAQRRQQNQRYLRQPRILTDHPAQAISRATGHLKVNQNGVERRLPLVLQAGYRHVRALRVFGVALPASE